MATFSEVFRVSGARIESLAALPEPVRSHEAILEAAERNPGLDLDDAASLIAWAREPERRAEIHAAAQRVREKVAPHTVEFVIPVYLTSLLPERMSLLRLSRKQCAGRTRAPEPG